MIVLFLLGLLQGEEDPSVQVVGYLKATRVGLRALTLPGA